MRSRCLLALALVAAAATPAIARERMTRVVSAADGLPAPEVMAIGQDAEGFLWFGTAGGLVRWDGARVVPWASEQVRAGVAWLAIASDAIYAADGLGTLWRIDPHDATTAEEVSGPDGPIRDAYHLMADATGALWVASPGGLYRHRDAGWDRPAGGRIDGDVVIRIGALRDGTILAATVSKVYRLDGDVATAIAELPYAVGMIEGDDGVLWIACDGAALWELSIAADGTIGAPVSRGKWARRGWDLAVRGDEAWFVMGGQTVRARPGGIPEDVGDDGRIPNADRAYVDREGSLWLGTHRGAYQLVEPGTAQWTTRDGLEVPGGRAIARSSEGLWIAGWGGGWSRIDDVVTPEGKGRVGHHSLDTMLRFTMCVDGAGDLWTGAGGQVHLRRGGAWQHFPMQDGDDYGSCVTLPDGAVIMTSTTQLLRAEPGGGAPRALASPHTSMRSGGLGLIAVDPAGALWVASHDEVCTAPLADVEAGAATWRCDPVDDARDIYAMAVTPSGDVWIGTNSGGVRHLRDGAWREIADSVDLPSVVVHVVQRARDGETIWLGGAGYLHRVRETAGGWEIVESLDERQGLEDLDAGAVLEDPDGTLWVATQFGIAEVEPRARQRPAPIARLVLVDAWVDGRRSTALGGWSLAAVHNQLELVFSALSYRAPADVRFRLRLDGGEWLTSGPALRLVDVPPGAHTLEVEASADGETWAGLAAPVTFEVPRAWWQRPWLWALAALVLVAIAIAIQRARYQSRLRLAKQRVRIAMDLHDEIGSGLGSIGMLAGMAASGQVAGDRRAELDRRVVSTTQRLGQSLTDIVATLRAGGDRVEALVDHLVERGQALMPGDAPRFELRAPPAWPAQPMTLAARRVAQAIALEALHNAARHSQAKQVELGLEADARAWRLWVEDDGVGIEAGDAPRPGGGRGLEGMRARAAVIGATVTIGAGAGGAGTRIELSFDPRAEERA